MVIGNDYVEVLTVEDFEKIAETKVEIISMSESDRKELRTYLEDFFTEEEILGLLELADGFAITDWCSDGWTNTISPSPSYGVFLARDEQILLPEDGEAIWTIQSEFERKRWIKAIQRGEFFNEM